MAIAANNKPSLASTLTHFCGFNIDTLGIVTPPDDITPGAITLAMQSATELDTTMRLVKADLLRIAALEFGEDDSAQWFDGRYFGSKQTARNYRYIGRRIPHAMRIPGVLWSHYALVAAGWITNTERAALLKLVVADGEVESVAWLREMILALWQKKYADLPYNSRNALAPEDALYDWHNSGRDEALIAAQQPAPKIRLQTTTAAFKRRLMAQQGLDVPFEVAWAFVGEMIVITEELST